MSELEPIEPEEARDMYLASKQGELAEATLYSHSSRIGHFIRWCDEQGIDNLNTVNGRDLLQYKNWRKNSDDVESIVTVKTQIDTLRVFIRWCEGIEAVEQDLSEKVQSPDLDDGDNVREVMVDSEIAKEILQTLRKYHYAQFGHVLFELLWHSSLRRGAARALDVGDYDAESQSLSVNHRPGEDTPLKNKEDGEREVSLSSHVCEVIDDWIADQRPEVTDEYGREPLLATSHGRPARSTIQTYVYWVTRPCFANGGHCPHDRDVDECDATVRKNDASKCPSSVGPHAVRRGSLTHLLRADTPKAVVSDRANLDPDVLDKHYDERTPEEKMEQRRRFVEDAFDDFE